MSTITDRIDPATDRVRAAALEGRSKARKGAARARESALKARDTADDLRDKAGNLRDRAEDLREDLEPAARTAVDSTVSTARTVAGWLAVLPGVAASVLSFLQDMLERVSEQGREVAATIEPPRHVRRRRAITIAGWFAGGFAIGAATGWIAHAQTREDPAYEALEDRIPDEAEEPSRYDRQATALDSRRRTP